VHARTVRLGRIFEEDFIAPGGESSMGRLTLESPFTIFSVRKSASWRRDGAAEISPARLILQMQLMCCGKEAARQSKKSCLPHAGLIR